MRITRSLAVAQRSSRVLARLFATGGKGAPSEASMNVADITKAFLEMDATTAAHKKIDLPIKLTGRSGELVQELYIATGKDSKKFEVLTKQLEGFVAAVEGGGLVVDRFFSTMNYSHDECKSVLDLLLTDKEPLKSFDSIKSTEVREVIVDNEGNLDAWRGARKAIAALGLAPEAKAALQALAAEGRLDLAKKLATKAGELKAVTSKTLDAEVRSAVALSKDQQAAVAKALPQYAPAGQTVNLNFTVDPAVLGGLLVTLKNQTIDLSSTSRLVEVVAAQ